MPSPSHWKRLQQTELPGKRRKPAFIHNSLRATDMWVCCNTYFLCVMNYRNHALWTFYRHDLSAQEFAEHADSAPAPEYVLCLPQTSVSQRIQFLLPCAHAGIRGHTQIPSGRERHASHLRPIRQAGAFKLLGEKPAVKYFHPLEYHCILICSGESISCKPWRST